MRLSRNQRDVLFLLWVMERRGKVGPVPVADLLKMINGVRPVPVAGSNFRVGLKTMTENGLVLQYRHPTKLTLAYQLTDEGRTIGGGIYDERTKQAEV